METEAQLKEQIRDLEFQNALLKEELEKSTDSIIANAIALNEYLRAMDLACLLSKTTPGGFITHVNDYFCTLSGFARHELIGQTHKLLRHPNMDGSIYDELMEHICTKQSWSGVLQYRKKDGSRFYMQCSVVPILDETDSILEFIYIGFDITYLIEKEKEIEKLRIKEMIQNVNRARRIKIEEFINMLPMPTILTNETYGILHTNAFFKELFDPLENDGILEKLDQYTLNFQDILMMEDDKKRKQFIQTLEAIGDEGELEIRIINQDNAPFTITMHSLICEDEEDRNFLIFLLPLALEESLL